MMPVVTVVGMSFAGLLGGAVIAEIIFGLPGVGSYMLKAIQMKDTPAVTTIAVLMAFLFSIIVLIIVLIYAYLDPRVKAQMR